MLDGINIRLTNTSAGRIIGGVVFAQGGNTLVNELGGIVRTANGTEPYNTVVIAGSSGSDTVYNAGLISGLVRLGAGNDRFFSTAPSNSADDIDLGDGDDLFEYQGTGAYLRVEGGSGTDRISLGISGQNVVYGDAVTGFETLSINLGYQAKGSVTLSNVAGITAIDVGGTASLALRGSDLASANLSGGFDGSISLDAASAIGRYGFPLDGPYDRRTDIAQSDDRLSVAHQPGADRRRRRLLHRR